MNNKKILDLLYYKIRGEEDVNAFDTAEMNRRFNEFYDRYTKGMKNSELDDFFLALGDVIGDEQRNAFKVGFAAAHKLNGELAPLLKKATTESGFNTGNGNTGDDNTGNDNTGFCNSGDYNTGGNNSGDRNIGDCNSGFRNAGNFNSGFRNSGFRNTGNFNTGNYNTGNYNTGDRNTGFRNIGNYNTGSFNLCNFSSGFFCTEEPKARIFDIETDMTVSEFYRSKHYALLTKYPLMLTEWVEYTENEKKADAEKELIGGYLKKYSFQEACKKWWSKYTAEEKAELLTMPNFDKNKFKEITEIEV